MGRIFLRNSQICERVTSNTTRKFLQIHKKRKMYQQAQEWLQPDRRQKQNFNRGNLLERQPSISERVWIDIEPSKQDLQSYNLSKKVINLLWHNQKLHREEDGAIQFYKIKLPSTRPSSPIQNWSDDRWIASLAAGGGSNEDISIALIIWDQSFISVLFKDILGAISLILHYRTTCWLDLEYSLTFTMWEAISIFIQLSAMDWYLEARIWAEDNLCSSCLLIQEKKITKIQSISTTLHHVSHDTCKTNGRDIKIRYLGRY